MEVALILIHKISVIYDNSEVYSSCNMLLKETMDKLNGVSVLSSHSQELNFIDKSFKNWTDETTSVNWKKSNCSANWMYHWKTFA